jgi:hypothetical protein
MLLVSNLRNPSLSQRHKSFSSRSFIVLSFTFRSMIYFEVIFAQGMEYELRFVHMHMDAAPAICPKTVFLYWGKNHTVLIFHFCSFSKFCIST